MMTGLPGGAIGVPRWSPSSLFIVLGSVLEGIPAMVLFGAAAVPGRAARSAFMRCTTPWSPSWRWASGCSRRRWAIGYYTACAIGRVAPDTAMRAIWPYVGALIAALVIVALFPWLSTCLL